MIFIIVKSFYNFVAFKNSFVMRKIITLFSLLLMTVTISAQKNILVEESTGTWCQYCTKGIYYGDSLMNVYDNVFFVAIHSSDPMGYSEYSSASGLLAAPAANIGRNFKELDIQQWFPAVEEEMQVAPNMSVSVANEYNESTRIITTTVTATALSDMSGDFRIGAIVIEDGVTGPAPGYNQANYYSGSSTYVGGYESMPNPVPADRMAFHHVARHLMGGYDGEEGSVPESLAADQTAEYIFRYQLPEEYNAEYIRVIGVVINNGQDGVIDNAGISPYLDGNSNAAPLFTSTGKTDGYVDVNYIYNIYFQDVDNEDLEITADNLPDWLSLEQTSNKSAVLSGTPSTPGDYEITLEVSDGERSSSQNYIITVEGELDGNWEYIGERAFTSGETYVYDMAYYNDECYVLIMKDSAPYVFKAGEDGVWHQLGDLSGGDMAFVGASMVINSQGEVYIGYTDNGPNWSYLSYIKKWDGNTWTNVGAAPESIEISLSLDNEETPYFVCRNCHLNYSGYVYKLENNQWIPVGGGPYFDNYPSWAKLDFDSNNVPYVCAADYPAQETIVYRLENGTWIPIHGDTFDGKVVYYYVTMEFNDNDELFVAYLDYTTRGIDVFQYSDSTWTLLGENVSEGPTTEHIDMAIKDRYPVLTYINQPNGNAVSVRAYNGESWKYIGPKTFSEGAASYPVVAVNEEDVFVAFSEEDLEKAASAMRYVINPDDPDDPDNPDDPDDPEEVIEINENNSNLNAYPTLVEDALFIESYEMGIMRIISMKGITVLESRINPGRNIIPVSNLQEGIYIIEIGGKTKRVIKQ